MQKEIKLKFPKWCEDGNENVNLILSDDIDSFMCYMFQKIRFNREVKYFFNANTINNTQTVYKVKDYERVNKLLALDIALEGNIMAWDNHVVKVSSTDKVNNNSANLNIVKDIKQTNYTSKGCVSSFITMLSYYEEDLTKLTKEQLAIICAIDGLYYPFTTSFKDIATKNLILLDYSFLADFIVENMQLIIKLERELNLKYGKIYVGESGSLETNIDLDRLNSIFNSDIGLPTGQFIKTNIVKKGISDGTKYKPCSMDKEKLEKDLADKGYRLFNFALTYKNSYIYSYCKVN